MRTIVCLFLFFCPLYCLSFFERRPYINSLICSNISSSKNIGMVCCNYANYTVRWRGEKIEANLWRKEFTSFTITGPHFSNFFASSNPLSRNLFIYRWCSDWKTRWIYMITILEYLYYYGVCVLQCAVGISDHRIIFTHPDICILFLITPFFYTMQKFGEHVIFTV